MDAAGGRGGFIPSPATEDETIARRRSRRVSFAETTAVHVFARDEDFETPPEERAASASPSPSRSPSPGRSSTEPEDGDETEEGEETPVLPVRFPREVDSSSPGSAAGSMVSNDDDNFFGPVSTKFIQSGRPSDSGISEDDNHDITLDSRTFSLHFRNVAPSDDFSVNSAASLMTPNPASRGPAKELTVSEPGIKLSSGQDTYTDMSVFTGNLERHDYDKRSTTLNNLVQKVKEARQTRSPKAGLDDVNPNHVLALVASDKEHREGNSSIGNGISFDELGIYNTLEDLVPITNPVLTGTDLFQDNAMIVDGREQSQFKYASKRCRKANDISCFLCRLENCNGDHMVVDPAVNRTLEPPEKISPPGKSFMSNVDIQSNLTLQSFSEDQPSGTTDITGASSMSNVDLEHHPLDQPLSKDQPPGANITNAPQLSTAADATFSKDTDHLHQQNEVMDRVTSPHTPETVVQPLQGTQGSISALRSKRQQLFSPNAKSSGKIAKKEACSLVNEFVTCDKRISDLKDALKFRLQESPIAARWPSVERNELGLLANYKFSNAEVHDSIISVSSNSILQRQLKKASDSFIQVTPVQGVNEATKVQNISCDDVTLGSQATRECDEQEGPEKTARDVRSPGKSTKQSSLPQSSYMVEERQNGPHGNGHSVNVDWNKAVVNISKATEQVFSGSLNKLNIQQLDMLGDKLDETQSTGGYKRLPASVRIRHHCGDQQKRLAEVRSLHDKLLYEKAKLQINNLKLDKHRDMTQLCQAGIQECCFLKSKILYSAKMKDASCHAETLIDASDRQEEFARVTEKRLELNLIQQKVDGLRGSLECLHNIEGDTSCDKLRSAEEQLELRNQCRMIRQQAGLCVLKDIVKRDSKHDIILNYCNFLIQRITLNNSNVHRIFVNNSLNVTKIGQTYPNLDASVAFNFVFKAEEGRIVNDVQSLQKIIMETSLLLGNLIYVLEEIQHAKLELLRLNSAAFLLESQPCRLGLSLCFMSFKNSKRIAFTVDMTDLNRSVYPSEPSDLSIKVLNAQTTLAEASTDKIIVSIRNLQPGRMVILNLCRMVSELIDELPG
ncbi:hypothetical protein ACP4OV_030752 [Aristida adscensionis]